MTRTQIPSETLAETLLSDRPRRAKPLVNAAPSARVPSRAQTRDGSGAIRKLMTGLTAAALALTLLAAAAVPARADRASDNLAKALAAALVIGAIVNGIDNNNDRVEVRDRGQNDGWDNGRDQDWQNRDWRDGRGHSHKYGRQPRVPQACAFRLKGKHSRSALVYSERCLRQQGFTYRLPDCGHSLRVQGKRDRVYSEQCLIGAGFSLGRR